MLAIKTVEIIFAQVIMARHARRRDRTGAAETARMPEDGEPKGRTGEHWKPKCRDSLQTRKATLIQ